jgi:hypothetical protein
LRSPRQVGGRSPARSFEGAHDSSHAQQLNHLLVFIFGGKLAKNVGDIHRLADDTK